MGYADRRTTDRRGTGIIDLAQGVVVVSGVGRREQPEPGSSLTRREVLRRGAVVGGTLLWVTPAIQSLTPNAFAVQQVGSFKACCQCTGTRAHPAGCSVDAISYDECFQRCGGPSRARYFVGRYTCVDGNCVPLGGGGGDGGEGRQAGGSKPARARPAA